MLSNWKQMNKNNGKSMTSGNLGKVYCSGACFPPFQELASSPRPIVSLACLHLQHFPVLEGTDAPRKDSTVKWFSYSSVHFRHCQIHPGTLEHLLLLIRMKFNYLFFFIVIKFRWHTIPVLAIFKVYNSVVFSMLTMLCDRHHCLAPEHLITP